MATDLDYLDTFVRVAADSTAVTGVEPATGPRLTVARAQFEMIAADPYRWRQTDVLVLTSAGLRGRDDLPPHEVARLREEWLSRPQACMRASPLPKTHGWGLHMDGEGRVALLAVGSPGYVRLSADPALTQLQAMASRRR